MIMPVSHIIYGSAVWGEDSSWVSPGKNHSTACDVQLSTVETPLVEFKSCEIPLLVNGELVNVSSGVCDTAHSSLNQIWSDEYSLLSPKFSPLS